MQPSMLGGPLKLAIVGVLAFAEVIAAQPSERVYFVTTSKQSTELVDISGKFDYAPSAFRSSNGTLNIFYCGSDTLPGGAKQDAIFRANNPVPGGSTVGGVPVLRASQVETRYDAFHLCDPSVFRHSAFGQTERYYMYYECTPTVYDRISFPNAPIEHTNMSLGHICLATSTSSDGSSGWKVYNKNLWDTQQVMGSPSLYAPTPVRYPANQVLQNCLISDNSSYPAIYTPGIDGRLWGDPTCDDGSGADVNYGVGHPSAITYLDWVGGRQIWLYYWDSAGDWFQRGMKLAKSWDGFNFEPVISSTNLNIPADIKYFPGLNVEGSTLDVGVWIATSVLHGENWFAYSFNGVDFEEPPGGFFPPIQQSNLELPEAHPDGTPKDLCVAPNSSTFVSDGFGYLKPGIQELISNEGKSGDPLSTCFSTAETPGTNRGSTWALYYLTGVFADLRINDVNYCQ